MREWNRGRKREVESERGGERESGTEGERGKLRVREWNRGRKREVESERVEQREKERS